MKLPNINNNNNNNNDSNNQDDEVLNAVDRLLQANARASRAATEAMELRNRLEMMENVLSQTKTKLASATTMLVEKDKQLQNVHGEAAALSQTVGRLEERFENLRKMQQELAEKRDKLGL